MPRSGPCPRIFNTGVDLDALEEAFRRSPTPRLAVLITDFHNPLGVSIAAENRPKIAELAAKYGVPLVEDDPYAPLRFKGEGRCRPSRPMTTTGGCSTWGPSRRCWPRP